MGRTLLKKGDNNENYGYLRLRPGQQVEHSDLSSATPGAADLFVMAKDIAASASVPESQLVVINNIIDINELEAQLRAWFERQ